MTTATGLAACRTSSALSLCYTGRHKFFHIAGALLTKL